MARDLVQPSACTPSSTSWEPLLRGSSAHRVAQALGDLASTLRQPLEWPSRPSERRMDIACGTPGLAMFFSYLATTKRGGFSEDADRERVGRWVADAVRAMSESPISLPLYGGFPGVGWLVAQLCDDDALAGVAEHIDGVLLEVLSSGEQHPIDLTAGLVGYGVYALETSRRTGNTAVLTKVLDHLERTAILSSGGRTWFTPAELLPEVDPNPYPQGYFNCGVSHGVPGVVGLLARMLLRGLEVERVRPLLVDAVRWLSVIAPQQEHARFPYLLDHLNQSDLARLAWCYGDPGVVPQLLLAARALGSGELAEEALACALASARRTLPTTGVNDASVCHGSAGVAHIYNRLFQATGVETFRQAALFWIEHLLDNRRDAPIAGFPAWDEDDGKPARYRPDPGLLTGAAGVGLVLAAAISPVEPNWDRLLLLDL